MRRTTPGDSAARRRLVRRRRLALVTCLLFVGILAVTYGLTRLRTSDARVSALTIVHPGTQVSSLRLTTALDAYLANRPGRVSVAVTDYANGVTAVYHPGERFETASIVKVDVLATLLLQAQDDHRDLTSRENSLAQDMIIKSGNDATDALWHDVGGFQQIAAANRRLGLTATAPDPNAWGLTTTTATDQLRLLTILLHGGGAITAPATVQARNLMASVADDQAWGISAAAHPGEVVALKNGWDTRDSDDDRWVVHSIGDIIRPEGTITLVVLSDSHPTRAAGIELVEKVATLVRDTVE